MGLFDLFKPAWKSKNKKKALKAVENLTDQAILEEIATSIDRPPYLAIAALKNITNQELLADIAKKSRNIDAMYPNIGRNLDICLAAVKNISELQSLLDVIGKADKIQVRKEAIKMLASLHHEYYSLNKEILNKISNEFVQSANALGCPKCGGIMDTGEGIHRNKGTVETWSRCRKCNNSLFISSRPIQDGDIT